MFNQQQSDEIIKRRHEIVIAYCKHKGWPTQPQLLSLQQIFEIRGTKDWKDVPTLVSQGK